VGALSSVERELAELWQNETDEGEAVVRACAHTLVVACADDPGDLVAATRIVARVSDTSPGRALVVAPTPTGSGVRPYVSAHCHRGPAGQLVCSEQITLEIAEDGLPLVAPSVLRLRVEDMPVYTWWRRGSLGRNELLESLHALSDCLIVDSRRFERHAEDVTELQRLASLSGFKGRVADLAWAGLDPWGDAIASFFDAPRMRASLHEIDRIAVAAGGTPGDTGFSAPAAWIVGWLAMRLDWTPGARPDRWLAADGREVAVELEIDPDTAAGEISSVRIDSSLGGYPATFAVRREPGSDVIVSTVESSDTCPLPRRVRLPERDEAALLCGTLQMRVHDPLFDRVLAAAARMV
jgi:glucose-6-phosphate dehydrogenase assembly protein OpcA